MSTKLNIAMIASEAIPFAKTGGLADVVGSLPKQLSQLGHSCSVFLPAYQQTLRAGIELQPTQVGFVVNMAGRNVACRILKAILPDCAVDFYFIDQPQYYDRPGLYGDDHGDFRDNCERFCFFSRAVVQAIDSLRLPVDVVHCHDWQSGLIPAFVKTNFQRHAWYSRVGVVMTIHNLAYQGRFWFHDMALTGLDWQYFNSEQLEFYGDLNLLKSGVVFADRVTTVSPTYAREIQTQAMGCALEGVLHNRRESLVGIVNGVDYEQWDPQSDEHLSQNYTVSNWRQGKQSAKMALQQELGLPVDPHMPLIGLIGRFADQKGWDLVVPLLRAWLPTKRVQWVILGSGEARYQDALKVLADDAKDRLALKIGFSEALAHKIEAASDIFLMPSRYEPCGLNQLYSLRYGAIPVIHATGGLIDTVTDANLETLGTHSATGFAFHDYNINVLEFTVQRALNMFLGDPYNWGAMVERAMQQDWSWRRSASQYEAIYREIIPGPL